MYIYIWYIFGFGLSSSVLSNVLVLASIARRNAATSRAPLLSLVSRSKILYLFMYVLFLLTMSSRQRPAVLECRAIALLVWVCLRLLV